jgi:hypothetical protein
MLALIVLGRKMVGLAKAPNLKISANAGWWAGLVLFVFIIIYHFDAITLPSMEMRSNLSVSIPGGVVGGILGFIVPWLLKILIQKRTIGIISMLLSAAGATSLFSYIFIRNLNNVLIGGVLGIAFGTLLHVVIFPENSYGSLLETQVIDKEK